MQLAIVGKGDKPRHVLLPADIAAKLNALRGDAKAKVFPILDAPGSTTSSRPAKRAGINPGTSAHWLDMPTPRTRSTKQDANHTGIADARPCRPQERRGPSTPTPSQTRVRKPLPSSGKHTADLSSPLRSASDASGRLCNVQVTAPTLAALRLMPRKKVAWQATVRRGQRGDGGRAGSASRFFIDVYTPTGGPRPQSHAKLTFKKIPTQKPKKIISPIC